MAEDYLTKFASPGFYGNPSALGQPAGDNRRVSGSTFTGDVDYQAQQEAIARYEKNVQDYQAQTDRALTTEIDTVDESGQAATAANESALGQAERDRRRYGVQFNAVQASEESRLANFSGASNVANAMNMARRSDETLNEQRLQIGSQLGSNNLSSLLSGLLQYGQSNINAKNAFQQNRNNAKKSQYGFLGSLTSSLAKLI
jgi:hypothetical protein